MSVADKLNTYTTIGNREDLSDMIADLFADDVPFFAMARKTKAEATKHEWTADALNAAATDAVIEGATVSYTKPTLRTRLDNYTHIRLRNWEVTHTQQKVTTAGVKNDVKRELLKAMQELLVDYDKIFLNSAAKSAGSTAAGRVAAGIQAAIVTNTANGTGTGNSTWVALTEGSVNARLQEVWTAGGNPRALFCGGYQKSLLHLL